MKRLVLIDNYDSFTYNLVHYFESLGAQVTVFRNDAFELDELERFDCIVLSPGPGLPKEAGLLLDVIRSYAQKKPILGICLGLQAIVEVFGGSLKNLPKVYHGEASVLEHVDENEPMFQNITQPIEVGRYHSWVAATEHFPQVLKITSTDEAGSVMSIRHRTLDVCAVQFHPESILTPSGKQMMENWLK